MKKLLPVVLLFLVAGWSANAQKFVQVTKVNSAQSITIGQDEVLEVKLPSNPSTGYAWELINNQGLVEQAGDWSFVSDSPENPIGAPGIQTIRYIGKAQGKADLEFVYKRNWEAEVVDNYRISVTTAGPYKGVPIEPVVYPIDPQLSNPGVPTRALPAKFSWLDEGKMTVCKNQGQCGSCWAFAACGSFESVIKYFDNVSLDLSEQWLVNCDTQSSGCSGGWCPDYMFKTYGAVYEVDQKYTQQNGTCKSTYTYHEKPKGYTQVATNPTVAQIKQAIYDYGAVWIAVCVGSNFNAYKAGTVLTKSDGTQVNHAVVLVGWDDAQSCWVLRNSWGTSWGEKSGYMRIGYGVSSVGYRTTYLDYKGIIPHVVTNTDNISNAEANNVFPNPTSGIFNINGLERGNTVEIYDVYGKLVSKNVVQQSSILSIDLSSQSKGMYFYKVIDSNLKDVRQGKVMVY